MDEQKLKEIVKQVRLFVERYCERSGYKLNPKKEIADMVIKGLAMNRLTHGFQYCPCRIVEGDRKKDQPKICPCKWHKEEIERDGFCHCQLFTRNR